MKMIVHDSVCASRILVFYYSASLTYATKILICILSHILYMSQVRTQYDSELPAQSRLGPRRYSPPVRRENSRCRRCLVTLPG